MFKFNVDDFAHSTSFAADTSYVASLLRHLHFARANVSSFSSPSNSSQTTDFEHWAKTPWNRRRLWRSRWRWNIASVWCTRVHKTVAILISLINFSLDNVFSVHSTSVTVARNDGRNASCLVFNYFFLTLFLRLLLLVLRCPFWSIFCFHLFSLFTCSMEFSRIGGSAPPFVRFAFCEQSD